VPFDVRDRLAADVARLLAEDGLVGVTVLPTSAVTGIGLAELRATLATVVAGPSTAAVRAGAEVGAAARLLARDVAPHEPDADDLPVAAVVDELEHATGLPATADAVAAAVRGRGGAVPAPVASRGPAVELAHRRWLTDVGADLPQPWRRSLAGRVPTAELLRAAVDHAVVGVPVDSRRSVAAAVLRVLAVLSAVAAVVLGAATVTRELADVPALDGIAWLGAAAWPAIGLAVLALVLFAVAGAVRRATARERAAAVRSAGRAALEGVVRAELVGPSLALVGEHREVRDLARSVGDPGQPA
jgi:hypothetical protein